MKRLSTLALALAALATTASAQAAVIDAKFIGTVQSQANAGYALNSPIIGEFVFDTVAAQYLSFVIGGQSIAAGFSSTAALTPDLFTALYRAQLSPVQQGGGLNSTFVVDLEALNMPWPANGAVALLLNAGQLTSNLDLANSSFGFFTANSDGTNVRSVSAALNRLQVSAAPEPASIALMLGGMAMLGLNRARRRR